EVARNLIALREVEVRAAEATRDLRKRRWERFIKLEKNEAVDAYIVDEYERDYRAAQATLESCHIAVKKSEADYEEKDSNLESTLADLELKRAVIEAARKDRDRAQAMASYARLTAPFAGRVSRRTASIGT